MRHIVRTFEEHGEVLAHWYTQGWCRETVIVFDRHLDLKKISPHQIDRLRHAPDPVALAQLNRDLPFRNDERYAYGLDNFLYAAAVLGLVQRLIWVFPEPTPLNLNALSNILLKRLALIPGHGEEIARTYTIGPQSICAQVATMTVEVTTLRRLRALDCSTAHLDFDLDFFYVDAPQPSHPVIEVVEVLKQGRLLEAPPTMTYSITSGFMPPSFRRLGKELSDAMGFALEESSPARGRAEQSMRLLASKTPLDHQTVSKLIQEELVSLGGPGWSMRALLALRCGQPSEAAQCYERARAQGDRASWAAYTLGLHYLTLKQYATAASWSERAEGELSDTIQAHASGLRALCELRLAHPTASLRLAEQSIALTPLNQLPYRVAEKAAHQLGLSFDHVYPPLPGGPP